jgi:ubiquinone/menaquinone biosynthesis C-methylase UbiE
MSTMSAPRTTETGSAKELRGQSVLLSASVAARRVSVTEGYELWAATYDRDPNPLLALEERALQPLLPDVRGKRVLDVACGTGRWLARLLGAGALSGAGVDLSSAMLRAGSSKAELRGRLARADSLALPFQCGVADLLICSFALGHIGDLVSFAREFVRVTKRGADVFVTDLHPEGYARGWRTGFRKRGESLEISTSAHSVGEVCEAFASSGLEPARLIEPCLDEPERPVFEQAGRVYLFDRVREIPAVLICHFRRPGGQHG